MIRTRLALAAALLLGAAPFAAASHAIACSPVIADVCATYTFVCQRLAAHNVHLALCNLD
jgi:hypothetical protein